MAHILELSDGTTTVDFLDSSGTSWCLIEDGGLFVGMPSRKVSWTGSYIGYGGSGVSNISYGNRRIEITFEIVGDDYDDIIDKLITIRRLVNQATIATITPYAVAAVYLKYQIDTLTNPVYFDVVAGSLKLPDNIMSVESLGWLKGSQSTMKGFVLTIDCKPFARGAEVLLASASATLGNTNDNYYDNSVSLPGASINGDSPGPLRLVVTGHNSYAQNRNPIWIGIKPYYNSNFRPAFEAENGDYVTHGGSLTSKSVAYSGDSGDGTGGYAVNYTISTTAEDYIGDFSVGASQVPYNKGKVRVLAVGSFSNECRYRIGVRRPDNTLSYSPYSRPENDYHATDNYIFDMGIVDFIPVDFVVGETMGGQSFLVCVQADDSSSKSIRFDALLIIPAEDYCYRKLSFTGDFGPSSATTIAEDVGIRDWLFYGTTSTVIHQGIAEGMPLHVSPGVTSRLFVVMAAAEEFDPSFLSSVDIYHTPYYFNIRGTE